MRLITGFCGQLRRSISVSVFCLAVIALTRFCAGQSASADVRPNEAELAKLVRQARAYAENYVNNLPNFLCEQVTEQFEAGRKTTHWKKGDTLTSKLVFSQGQEQRTLELVNNNVVKPGVRARHRPLTTEGEFGSLIDRVFTAVDDAGFHWNRFEAVSGIKCAVFDYAIDVEHSTMRLINGDLGRATVPYSGSVFVDPSAGSILRITDVATDIPKEIQTRSISTAIDYQPIEISGTRYLLPSHATVMLDTGSNNLRHEISFQNYRKFAVESNITFGSASDSTNEQGPKNQPSAQTPPRP